MNYRSSSFKLNPSTNSTAATQRPVSSYNNQPHYHSDLSNLSLIYLKKGVSSSSSFHNKINLYSNNRHTSDSTSDSTQQKDEEQEGEFQMDHKQTPKIMSSMESLLTTATNNHRSQRPLSTNLNTANVNRRIGPIVASAASNCNLVSAGVSGGLGAGFTDILKPPLPHQSLSSFSEFLEDLFFELYEIRSINRLFKRELTFEYKFYNNKSITLHFTYQILKSFK